MSAHVRFVVPQGIDDLARPSGGNGYDRRIRDGLRARGWDVQEVTAPGPLARTLGGLPDGALVLVDGLVASTAGPILLPEADRLRIVVLVHMPLGGVEVPEDDEGRGAREHPGLVVLRHLHPAQRHVHQRDEPQPVGLRHQHAAGGRGDQPVHQDEGAVRQKAQVMA